MTRNIRFPVEMIKRMRNRQARCGLSGGLVEVIRRAVRQGRREGVVVAPMTHCTTRAESESVRVTDAEDMADLSSATIRSMVDRALCDAEAADTVPPFTTDLQPEIHYTVTAMPES